MSTQRSQRPYWGRLKRILRYITLGVSALGAAIVINDFTKPESEAAIRTRVSKDDCGSISKPIVIGPSSNPSPDADESLPQSWNCTLAAYENAVHKADNLGYRHPNTFSISFLEFNSEGKLKSPEQLQALQDHLKANRNNFLITYVHGWRHDASRGDGDVSDLRKFACYSKSFLNYRCEHTGRYCDTEVTAVYADWPGKSTWFDPSAGPMSIIADPAVAPTLHFRKSVSEHIAPAVIQQLRGLGAMVSASGSHDSKMLVVGHSLGGNLLITGLKEETVKRITNHAPRALMDPILGDLVVLINPAAEAEKWIALQSAIRAKVGMTSADLFNDSGKLQALWPIDQPPLVVSLTSACWYPDWWPHKEEEYEFCDHATYKYFPINAKAWQWITEWNGDISPEYSQTIGHYFPTLSGSPLNLVGSSHELEINGEMRDAENELIDRSTTFDHAANRTVSECKVVDGWLWKARERQGFFTAGWDAGYLQTGNNPRLAPINGKLSGQFINALLRNNDEREEYSTLKIAGPNDPFWNVRTSKSAVEDHGGYVSYPLWCVVNQLVLDDIANGGASPSN